MRDIQVRMAAKVEDGPALVLTSLLSLLARFSALGLLTLQGVMLRKQAVLVANRELRAVRIVKSDS